MSALSRKSMIYKFFETTPQEALNGTSVLNTISLIKGAKLLRVHDVKEAVECVKLYMKTYEKLLISCVFGKFVFDFLQSKRVENQTFGLFCGTGTARHQSCLYRQRQERKRCDK